MPRKIEEIKEQLHKKMIVMTFNFPLPMNREMKLSDILDQEVSKEYFLSQKTIAGLLKGQATPQLLEP